MALPAGTRFGPYEILAPLGAGGMGEVYRARDTRLDRDVAIKVLPASFASDTDRVMRFEREAKTLASLNHPHIAQIYGVEDAGGQFALTMELVEGDTLDDWIAAGPRPFNGVRPVAIQIADALGYAHERGIIHRDLKPANIKISSEGAAKVLDFGLAKSVAAASGPASAMESDASAAMTFNSPAMTGAGVILGTAAYMAPEQARGVAVDKRADIWAFGVVLFELLSGQRLFAGGTVSDTLAAVLKNEPDFSRLPQDTPSSIRRLLQRCLQKDRRRRLQDIGDARIELEDVGHGDDAGVAAQPRLAAPRRRVLHAVALVAAGAAAALIAAALWPRTADDGNSAASTPYRFSITSADGIPLDDPPIFAISPDGKTLAVRGSDNGVTYLYLRSLVDGSVRRLSNSRGAGVAMAWSPDSQSLAFVRGGRLTILNTADTSGVELPLSPKAREGIGQVNSGGLAWTADREIVVASTAGMVMVPINGGERIHFEPTNTRLFTMPWSLPDGQILVSGRAQLAGGPGGGLYMLGRDGTGDPKRLASGSQPQYVPPGLLLGMTGERLVAWPFDARRNEIVGEAAVVLDNVTRRMNIGRPFSASNTGILAVRTDVSDGATHIAWFNRSGGEASRLKLEQHCRNPEFSPSFERIALECYEPGTNNRDIWLYDVARDTAMRFTSDQSDDSDALWSTDGRTIVFTSSRNGAPDVFQKSSGGAAPESLLAETPGSTYTSSWSPDGKDIALIQFGSTLILDLASKTVAPFGDGSSALVELQFSPDGRWVSYGSDESGRFEIYVQPWPATGDKWQISTSGGTDARWRPDGKELYFLSPARELIAVTIDTTQGFSVGAASRLFEANIAGPLGSGQRFPYAVNRDGSRFLMYVSDTNAPLTSITVIVNWPALIARRQQE